ncbi:MAG: carbon-nitrogen hydrolase family protein [Chitinophagaceae bacterium]|nr:MAG: carbon-nitrogen hydrolase family protein [Chitinophagaceae bacterium]
MKIALASPPFPVSLEAGLKWADTAIADASARGAAIISFPESYLPGYPVGYVAEKAGQHQLQSALEKVCSMAARHSIGVVMPMDWHMDGLFYNLAFVINPDGSIAGNQTKNQLDPSEDRAWDAGNSRQVFDIDGLRFGVVICHEGFRYPETVRWAATRGAQLVFHPNCSGNDQAGVSPVQWGHKDNPYYEKAQMMRALENTIYIGTSNYGFRYSESASALIAPDGRCVAHQPYGVPGVLVETIDLNEATGLLAARFKPSLYGMEVANK